MTTPRQQLLAHWRAEQDRFVDDLARDMQAHSGPTYRGVPFEQLRDNVAGVIRAWHTFLESGDLTALFAISHRIGQQRAIERIDVDDAMALVDIVREHILAFADQFFAGEPLDPELMRAIETALHQERKAMISAYGTAMTEAQARLAEREQALEAQGQLIQQLSSPILPIHEGVLVLPLVGTLDAHRSTRVMEAALERIVAYQAEVLILDITGVPVVDTNVANHLLQMARAVKLLGAHVVLVGIGAEIAQTIVQLGVDLGDMATRSNLQAGIAFALERQGRAIVALV
jgi:rsbT co-antagonist protein RsbR